MTTKLEVKKLTKIFGENQQEALELTKNNESKQDILEQTGATVGVYDASFEVQEGEVFVIMGLSGSGKSTLVRMLNRFIDPTDGAVEIDGENIMEMSDDELREIRRKKVSMVFQNFGLLPHRTILDNATFGLELRGDSKEARYERGMEVLETVGLKGYEQHYPGAMSGGMQQRVGLARALANNTDVLLMDEAFSALDPLIKSDMQDELLQIQSKLQKTIVFITHDLDEAFKIGDRIAIMKDGVIEQIGTAEEILANPASDYIKAFIEKVDRKTVITAETLMFRKPTIVKLGKDGPKGAIRKMRSTGQYVLPVENSERKFLGYVELTDVIQLARKKEPTVEKALQTEVPSVHREYTVEEMIPLISDNTYPIAVVDRKSGRLHGLVSQTSIVIEATRYDDEEVSDLIEKANEI